MGVALKDKMTKTNGNKQKRCLAIITSVAVVIALAGVGFGIYELIMGIQKDREISDLRLRIEQLASQRSEEVSELRARIEQLENVGAKIKIISSSWSGWSRDYVPEETESYCSLELNKKCVVKTRQYSHADGKQYEEDILSFEVVKINNDSVVIHTFQNFSDSEKGIDLRSKKRDFVIKNGESIELTTPTMDYGDIFTLTLLRD